MGHLKTTPKESEHFPARNESAFTKAFKWLFAVLVTVSMKIVKCYHVATDTVSGVFTNLWDKAYSFETFHDLRYWLYRTTRNASLNARTRNRFVELSDEMMDTLLTDDDGKHYMSRERALDQIAIALTKLSPRDQMLFRLAYVEGKSLKKIAERLGIATQTVSNRKAEVLKSIRLHLTNYRLSWE